MSCVQEIRCGLTQFLNNSEGCQLCGMRHNNVRATGCGRAWSATSPRDTWWGHGADIWLMEHGTPSEEDIQAALAEAREWFCASPLHDGRGHFKLRDYDGHAALELFKPTHTIPIPLSDALAGITDEACLWFFDPERMLPDPAPYRREIGAGEISERLRGYQFFIDKETDRSWNLTRYSKLPPLWDLPEEQQVRLVQWWDRLWHDWLGQHCNWGWSEEVGFWEAGERIYPLTEKSDEGDHEGRPAEDGAGQRPHNL